MEDSLQLLPVEKWSELQRAFKSDWPRGMSGYYTLETQRRWLEQGFHYGFQVYCPYANIWNGMVGINEKNKMYEIVILCPRSDTAKLEDALRTTKLINWRRFIMVPFAEEHVINCIHRIKADVGVEIKNFIPSLFYILDKNKTLFENVDIPPGITFEHLKEDNIPIINKKWPHRYPGSEWYFQQLIKSKNGYGLFQDGSLMAWVFINEMGALGHLYVLEEHRRKGLAELITKLLCNMLLKDGKDVMVYCIRQNEIGCKLYDKLGFTISHEVSWYFLDQLTEKNACKTNE